MISSEHAIRRLPPRTRALIVGLRIIRRHYPNLRSVETYHIAPGTALDPRVTVASNCPLASPIEPPGPFATLTLCLPSIPPRGRQPELGPRSAGLLSLEAAMERSNQRRDLCIHRPAAREERGATATARQPRRPNDIEATLALPGGHEGWLGYDNFAISPWRTLANEAWRGVRGSGSEAEGRPPAAGYLRRLNVAPPAPTVHPCRRQERRTTIPRTTTSDRPPPGGFWSTITCGRRSAAARAAFASGRLTPRPGTRSATADGGPSWARTTG